MGYKKDTFEDGSYNETWWEERFCLNDKSSYHSLAELKDKSLVIGTAKYDENGEYLGLEYEKGYRVDSLHKSIFPVFRGRLLQKIIPNSTDPKSEDYTGFISSRNFSLFLDVMAVNDKEVTIVINRGFLDYERKEDPLLTDEEGNPVLTDFKVTYGPLDISSRNYLLNYRQYQSSYIEFIGKQADAIFDYGGTNIDGDGDYLNPEYPFSSIHIDEEFWKKALRFGSTSTKQLGNPSLNKDVASLKAKQENELLFIFKRDNSRELSGPGDSLLYPAGCTDFFFSIDNIDNAYKDNKDYVVVVLGTFEFDNGIVSKKDGPFNISFGTQYASTATFGVKIFGEKAEDE